MRIRSVTPVAGLARGDCKLVWLGFMCLTMSAVLHIQNAAAEDYLTALEAEAAEVKAVEKELPDTPPTQKSETTATGKDPYLNALEAEADDLESQQSKKTRGKNTTVRFSHIRF